MLRATIDYLYKYTCVYFYIFSAAQAAVPPPRSSTEILSNILQSTTEHLAEKPSESSANRSENGAELMKNVHGTMAAPKRDFGQGGRKPQYLRRRFMGLYSWSQKHKKDMKHAINKSCWKRAPKNMNIDTERVPKGKQNRCRNTSKINAKICIGKSHRHHQ